MEAKPRKRGRPRKDPERTKGDYLDIRLGATEKQAFRDVADLAGLDLSAWVRERLRAAARKELEGECRSVAFLTRPSARKDRVTSMAKKQPRQAGKKPKPAVADLNTSDPIRRISAEQQRRLDYLMGRNNEGRLNQAEQKEFQALARELEQLTIDNARKLAGQGGNEP